ncbi:hypothetical protein FEK35_23640 [Nocardia cyriacigeorgica]|uniref:Uncharacterized protein n=1 Tax=Nocardia cyriacigeorgica TaxID=135487 RepID=A0A5R8P883_9NOCA|nr:hypothetical protein [Nocardia cyriacigeorgica]TLG01700.1 hypothetical protein FEK35_23640 [Nocardia cyriacigeorgica]
MTAIHVCATSSEFIEVTAMTKDPTDRSPKLSAPAIASSRIQPDKARTGTPDLRGGGAGKTDPVVAGLGCRFGEEALIRFRVWIWSRRSLLR